MEIALNLPHVFTRQSSDVDNARALRALLDCMVQLNLAYIEMHPTKPLYESGVRYGRTRIWETIPALYERGVGDCKSLASARVAELTLQGVLCRPVFRFNPRADGNKDFHILIQTPKGWEDPSKKLGMLDKDVNRFYVDTGGMVHGEGMGLFTKIVHWFRS